MSQFFIAVFGGLVGVVVTQVLTHSRARTDREEHIRSVGRESVSELLGAMTWLSWELRDYLRAFLASGQDSLPQSLQDHMTRFLSAASRARIAVVDPEVKRYMNELGDVIAEELSNLGSDKLPEELIKPKVDGVISRLTIAEKKLESITHERLRPGGPEPRTFTQVVRAVLKLESNVNAGKGDK